MKRLKDFSIKTRLYGLVVNAVLGFTATLGLTYWMAGEYAVSGPLYDRLMLRKSVISDYQPGPMSATEAAFQLSLLLVVTDPAESRSVLEHYRKLHADYRERQEFVRRDLFDGPLKRTLEKDVFPPTDQFFRMAEEEFLPLVAKNDKAAANQLFVTRMRATYQQHRQAIDRAVEVGLEMNATEEADVKRKVHWGNSTLFLISLGTVVLIGLSGWYLSVTIHNSAEVLLARVREMASGASDLTARVPVDSRDEMGQLAEGINGMVAKIQAVVSKVRESSLQILSAASQIAATARQQDATVNGLSSATTEVAAAVREISATGKELSGTMNEVNGRANQAARLASAGRERLGGMEQTMQQLVASTGSISNKLATIREKADSINMVVLTITKVADQTNLLSINAAIEAEKAGEFGRGFLVVAREIRRLADQTAVATLDIENIVRLMQEAVATGVMQMDKFSDEVRTSVTRVGEINTQTGQIIAEVSGLSDRFEQVNEGMRNQAVGAGQINDAMVSMSGDIRKTATSLEEFNRATAHLRGSIELLNQEVAQFKV
ncbi:methyl-accepting chemotaxis protein [Limnoglobus roseus]|uniref:Methyl-accepting chemotaxis protein n=1 Tax=Limnoglobus roseus TaxID=2598579 RepID=A0A5C1A362_9BACT|nr:methyl-accepting chemotaxis protein [Limnoglobus roseus]QEL13539.1 methyl-accepting chemotaxis protein [Limnoglobus roseus]